MPSMARRWHFILTDAVTTITATLFLAQRGVTSDASEIGTALGAK